MKKFIFDVDGTLTPSRKEIKHEFWAPFLIFCREHDVYLVTGSDAYERNVNVYRDKWELPKKVERFLEDE